MVYDVSQFDAYPMSRDNELLKRLNTAHFSRHWMCPRATGRFPCLQSPGGEKKRPSPLCMVCTSLLCLGCLGPQPTSCLMDRVLHPHAAYTAVYLDDVIIHSSSQVEHMQRVAALVESLTQTGLTVNPKNYAVGLAQDQKGVRWFLG